MDLASKEGITLKSAKPGIMDKMEMKRPEISFRQRL